ncbi:MAG: hypothetical protein N0E48_19865 [Candidatus Thiodiazotropha endolucinida]|nr:hypothetical protein [Candidatus Thiodiazotropha taylori]MCW4345593.1 hypothetical protein [Candidatus Thiodiazotropha endolucinida]
MASWEGSENGKYNPTQARSIIPTCTDDSQYASLNPFDIDKQISQPKLWQGSASVVADTLTENYSLPDKSSNWKYFEDSQVGARKESVPYTPLSNLDSEIYTCYAQHEPVFSSTPRYTGRNVDIHDSFNRTCIADQDPRRVRFSEAGLYNSVPFSGQTCETVFADNYHGSQGLGGQTEFHLSEPQANDDLYNNNNSQSYTEWPFYPQPNVDNTPCLTPLNRQFRPTFTSHVQPRFVPSVINNNSNYQHSTPTAANLQIPQRWSYPYSASFRGRADRLVRREKEPDKFDGKSVDLQDYLVHFEQVAAWNNWGYTEKGLQLSMSLKGPAQKLLTDMHSCQVRDYNSLKRALETRFNPHEKGFAYRCEFRSRVRKKNETPAEYGYALKRLADMAFPNVHYTGREQYTIDQFIHGLSNSELRKHVQLRHPLTLAMAISYAVEFEAVDSQLSADKKPAHVRFSLDQEASCKSVLTETDFQLREKQMSELLESLKNLLQQMTPERTDRNKHRSPSPQARSKIECYECHDYGHYAAECPNRHKTKRSSSPSPSRKSSPNKSKQEN